jgi:hypothetical protein
LRKEITLDVRFAPQNLFIEDTSRFVSAQCSRRAGKTNGLALRFLRTMEKHPNSQCVYLALTRESAKDIMWGVLEELNASYNLGCTFTESKLEMKHPNGSTLKLYGADMKNFIKRLKGRKFPGVAIDEAQDFGVHLQSLIDDVLTPATSDYNDGWLAITGTPGPVPFGYFFDITHEGKYGFSRHAWTLLENPYMPNPEGFIADLINRRQWEPNHPTLLREYRNKWVLDVQSLWISYNETKNHYANIPIDKDITYIMGIDIGFKDADAIAVVAWTPNSPCTYLVEEVIAKKQDITSLVESIKTLANKYNVAKMVIDQGGLGLKVAEEIRRRHHIPVVGAEKQRKQETVAFLNDHLRLGLFKAKSGSKFAQDSYLVQIDWEKSTPDRIVVKKQPHSDIIDAVIYAFKESPAFTYEAPKPTLKYRSTEWQDAEAKRLEEEAEQYFKKLEEEAENPEDPYNY